MHHQVGVPHKQIFAVRGNKSRIKEPSESPNISCPHPKLVTLVKLLVGGQPGILFLASLLGLKVVELIAPLAGLVGEDDPWSKTARS